MCCCAKQPDEDDNVGENTTTVAHTFVLKTGAQLPKAMMGTKFIGRGTSPDKWSCNRIVLAKRPSDGKGVSHEGYTMAQVKGVEKTAEEKFYYIDLEYIFYDIISRLKIPAKIWGSEELPHVQGFTNEDYNWWRGYYRGRADKHLKKAGGVPIPAAERRKTPQPPEDYQPKSIKDSQHPATTMNLTIEAGSPTAEQDYSAGSPRSQGSRSYNRNPGELSCVCWTKKKVQSWATETFTDTEFDFVDALDCVEANGNILHHSIDTIKGLRDAFGDEEEVSTAELQIFLGEVQKHRLTHNRRALIIGNSEYSKESQQKNLAGVDKDVTAMMDALEYAGYKVDSIQNKTQREMRWKFEDWARNIKGGDDVLIYFAGHGVMDTSRKGGCNSYLLPCNPMLRSKSDVPKECISLDEWILQICNTGARMKMFIIDACKVDMFSKTKDGKSPTRDQELGIAGRGVVPLDAKDGTDTDEKQREMPELRGSLESFNERNDDLTYRNIMTSTRGTNLYILSTATDTIAFGSGSAGGFLTRNVVKIIENEPYIPLQDFDVRIKQELKLTSQTDLAAKGRIQICETKSTVDILGWCFNPV